MIAFFIKNWRIFLDVVLVVAAILAFTFWDPWGMFSKAKLRTTANLVSSVQGIGELVTSEYYGEVISSLNETRVYHTEEDTLTEMFNLIYREIKDEIVSAWKDPKKINLSIKKNQNISPNFFNKNRLYDALSPVRTEYNQTDKNYYSFVMAYLAAIYLNEDLDRNFDKDKEMSKRREKKVIKDVLIPQFNEFVKPYEKLPKDSLAELLQNFVDEIPLDFEQITNQYFRHLEENLTKKEKKRDIVFIGRGWVKAGFRFDRLDERNFYYDENAKIVQLYGLSPAILDKDINPWFVPQKGIQGFELVDFYNKADFKEAKQVKAKCKVKLLEQAETAGILAQAKENGRESLEVLFSLLLDEPNLKVQFLDFPFEQQFQMIIADSLVSVHEALMLDSIYTNTVLNKLKKKNSKRQLYAAKRNFKSLMDRLDDYPFVSSDYSFNWSSLIAARVLEHERYLSQTDFAMLAEIRNENTLHSDVTDKDILTTDTLSEQYGAYYKFTAHWNEMMQLIDKRENELRAIHGGTRLVTSSERKKLDDGYVCADLDTIERRPENLYRIKVDTVAIDFGALKYLVMPLKTTAFDSLKAWDDQLATKVLFLINQQHPESTFKKQPCFNVDEFKALRSYKTDSIVKARQAGPMRSIIKSFKSLSS